MSRTLRQRRRPFHCAGGAGRGGFMAGDGPALAGPAPRLHLDSLILRLPASLAKGPAGTADPSAARRWADDFRMSLEKSLATLGPSSDARPGRRGDLHLTVPSRSRPDEVARLVVKDLGKRL